MTKRQETDINNIVKLEEYKKTNESCKMGVYNLESYFCFMKNMQMLMAEV